jgi:tetraacyldisaccharide 4'-kinase
VNPFSALYGAAVHVRNELYDRGLIAVQRLQGPVVSIGNLVAGGSGKTPFLILLGELLQQRGVAFDVLSRGYRRQTQGVAIVDPSGLARDFGDEPLLIARKLGVHVVVGEDRRQAGELVEATFGPQLHLLDDGFQHRRLARDFDIVLVTSTDGQDSLLPVGRLREPIASLARADAIVLTNDTPADGLRLQEQLVWRVRRDIVPPETLDPCFAFCGIARPERFFEQLQAAQVVLAGTRSFRDHHRYTDADVRDLLRLRQQAGANLFVTTEKDAVNLGELLHALQPIHTVRVRMQWENADAALDAMLAVIAERKQRAT